MKLNEKRRQAIYTAVTDEVMSTRVQIAELNLHPVTEERVQLLMFKLGKRVGQAAIEVAEGVRRK